MELAEFLTRIKIDSSDSRQRGLLCFSSWIKTSLCLIQSQQNPVLNDISRKTREHEKKNLSGHTISRSRVENKDPQST